MEPYYVVPVRMVAESFKKKGYSSFHSVFLHDPYAHFICHLIRVGSEYRLGSDRCCSTHAATFLIFDAFHTFLILLYTFWNSRKTCVWARSHYRLY
jgi:hypothetical protein